jgi:hypothetical protein
LWCESPGRRLVSMDIVYSGSWMPLACRQPQSSTKIRQFLTLLQTWTPPSQRSSFHSFASCLPPTWKTTCMNV